MTPLTNHSIDLSIYADWLEDNGRYKEADWLRESLAESLEAPWQYECVGVVIGGGGGGVGGVVIGGGGGGGVGVVIGGGGVDVGGVGVDVGGVVGGGVGGGVGG